MQHETIRRARETVEKLNGVEHEFAKRQAQGDPLAKIVASCDPAWLVRSDR